VEEDKFKIIGVILFWIPGAEYVEWKNVKVFKTKAHFPHFLCENLCEKNFPKTAKMWKICPGIEKINTMILRGCGI